MFLSGEDLEALTGWKRPKEQIKFLKDQAIPHLINAAGKPVVLRSVIDKRLGGDLGGIDTNVDMEQFERNLWTLNNGFKNKDGRTQRCARRSSTTTPASSASSTGCVAAGPR